MTTPKIIIGEHTITIERNGMALTPQEYVTQGDEHGTPVQTSVTKASDPLPDSPADNYFTGGAIKALKDEGDIGGYLVVWGSPSQRDKQGEYFTPDTEFRLDYYQSRPVLFHHGLADADSIKIGEITALREDDKGLYAQAKLFLQDDNPQVRRFAQRAWDEAQNDKMFWSSGSIAHLVEIAPNGQIKKWPLVEGSLTPTPAEPYRTKVDALKSACSALFCTDTPKEPVAKEDAVDATKPPNSDKQNLKRRYQRKANAMFDMATVEALREKGFNDTQILDIMGTMHEGESEALPDEDGMMADDDPMDDEEEPFRSAPTNAPANGKSAGGNHPPQTDATVLKAIQQLQTKNKELAAEMQRMKSAPPTESVPGRKNNQPTPVKAQVASKWDRLSWQDMLFVKTILDGANRYRGRGDWTPENPEQYVRALATKIEKSDHTFEPAAIKALRAIKDDEVNYSTLASYGDEFVPDLWRAVLWDTPRLDNPVFRELMVIEMPSDPYNIPIEGSDPTIYAVSETANETQLGINDSNAAIPDTQVGTSNTTLAAGKLAARINISAELVEDSIIPVAAHWRFKAVRAMEDARDAVLLSGDATTGTSNINNNGGSISATSRFLYGGGDGLLHLPLVTDTTLGVDMTNAKPTLAKVRQARTQLNTAILADFGNLVYFCDPLTSVALASMDEFVDASINGRDSTVNSGYLGMLDNIPIFVTNQMSLATSTGVVSSTAASNTRGRLLLAHVPSWYVGFRRNINANLAFQPEIDAWTLVISMRMALARRAADVSTLLYNIAV